MKYLDRCEEWFIASLMAVATAVVFIAVVHRYAVGFRLPIIQDWLLQLNLSWAQELCIILFVWMAKFGAAYGVRTGIHVSVDLVLNRLEGTTRRIFILWGLCAGALFTGIVSILGWQFIWENGMHYATLSFLGLDVGDVPEGPTTPDLEWPTWMVYAAVPLGSCLMCFRFLQVAWIFVTTGTHPHADDHSVEGIAAEDSA